MRPSESLTGIAIGDAALTKKIQPVGGLRYRGTCFALTLTVGEKGSVVRHAVQVLLASLASLLLAIPAHAAGSIALPEPGALTLLSIGVAGVLIGRRVSRKPPQD